MKQTTEKKTDMTINVETHMAKIVDNILLFHIKLGVSLSKYYTKGITKVVKQSLFSPQKKTKFT